MIQGIGRQQKWKTLNLKDSLITYVHLLQRKFHIKTHVIKRIFSILTSEWLVTSLPPNQNTAKAFYVTQILVYQRDNLLMVDTKDQLRS